MTPPAEPRSDAPRWWLFAPLPPLSVALAVLVIAHCIALARAGGHIAEAVVEGKCGPENTTKIRVPEAGFCAEFVGRPRESSGAG